MCLVGTAIYINAYTDGPGLCAAADRHLHRRGDQRSRRVAVLGVKYRGVAGHLVKARDLLSFLRKAEGLRVAGQVAHLHAEHLHAHGPGFVYLVIGVAVGVHLSQTHVNGHFTEHPARICRIRLRRGGVGIGPVALAYDHDVALIEGKADDVFVAAVLDAYAAALRHRADEQRAVIGRVIYVERVAAVAFRLRQRYFDGFAVDLFTDRLLSDIGFDTEVLRKVVFRGHPQNAFCWKRVIADMRLGGYLRGLVQVGGGIESKGGGRYAHAELEDRGNGLGAGNAYIHVGGYKRPADIARASVELRGSAVDALDQGAVREAEGALIAGQGGYTHALHFYGDRVPGRDHLIAAVRERTDVERHPQPPERVGHGSALNNSLRTRSAVIHPAEGPFIAEAYHVLTHMGRHTLGRRRLPGLRLISQRRKAERPQHQSRTEDPGQKLAKQKNRPSQYT